MESKFTHGQEVAVFDANGKFILRGKVMGIPRCNPTEYDIQPIREMSLARRLRGVPESQLRPIGRPVLAYERPESKPKHVMDEA